MKRWDATTKLRESFNAEKAERTQKREEMMSRLRKRDLDYERHGGVPVTVETRGEVTIETRGTPPGGCRRCFVRLGL